ncbi:DNA mismatch repair protein MutS [Anaplasma marginale]|uniref:DNA mismatch repair protein MutS n=1 Tax=Anaplasma marginale TaxID=770 RepID=UPI001239D982|nr:DNA mismatch repair protein MutS [Anaplasma marginale]KAA8473099.1 DNA mismatch repair protein MutS [Anaplasma marginale]KAB0451459.1 DNA mismatch repair protein MutS [Anaplasma marginale]
MVKASDNTEYTPIIRQYKSLKDQYEGCLLFYRLGDFYELFFDDAVVASRALDIVLTKRGAGTPMCGIPTHSADSYLGRLVKLGHKVAICEQLETVEEARKRGHRALVKRDVVRIVTPGTLLEDGLLEASENNYLACLSRVGDSYGVAWMDLSAGIFNVRSSRLENIDSEIQRIRPRELLISDRLKEQREVELILRRHRCAVTSHSESFFDVKKAEKVLCGIYGVNTLRGLGNFTDVEVSACGSLVEYVRTTQKNNLPKLGYPKVCDSKSFVLIDGAALRNLELFCTQSGEKEGALVSVIDRTVTAIGSRLLKRHLAFPSSCPHVINSRQDAVEFFVKSRNICESIRDVMRGIPDMERILTRIKLLKCSPRDVCMLGKALAKILRLQQIMLEVDNPMLVRIVGEFGEHEKLLKLISGTILENNAANARDGGFINPACNARLATVVRIESESDKLMQDLRDKYRKLTGIGSLKIAYNSVLGYYIETPASHKLKDTIFIHRQSLAHTMRHTTAELRELEETITAAKSEIMELEAQIFRGLCLRISEEAQSVELAANAVAELDVLISLARLAVENKYVRPIVDDSREFAVKRGRHPVVETGVRFIANDVNLSEDGRMWLITGPNMAGKSTFLRQNALIAILAHIGSFVPAESAHIGVIDKIFSRVGASDSISLGYSTFMVEMAETAAILNQATDRSLVILDEVGRGTGIHDGFSIALAVIEHIHDVTKSRAICATHYHELPKFSSYLKNVQCFYMKIEEWQGQVVFLHELVTGISGKSYGIYVAELAGFPKNVLERARFFMGELGEGGSLSSNCEGLVGQHST